jgi:hypothetical protein
VLQWSQVVLTATPQGSLYFVDEDGPARAAAAASGRGVPAIAQLDHARLGHVGFGALADFCRQGVLIGEGRKPAAYLQARNWGVCRPCVEGTLRRDSHPPRDPRLIHKLHRAHMDLCDLPNAHFSTATDEATLYATVDILSQKSEAAGSVARLIAFYETQTDLKVQRVRTDRDGEYMCGVLKRLHDERGIQHEPTAGYSPEAICWENGTS